MLAQALNRDFMLGVTAATEQQLRAIVANRQAGLIGRPGDPREIDTSELIEVADALAEALEREQAAAPEAPPAGDAGDVSKAGAAGEAPPPKDDYAYIPREVVMGVLQTALESHVEAVAEVEERVMTDDRRSGPLPVVTDRRIKGVDLSLSPQGRRLWRRMEVAHPKLLSDPRWAKSVISMIKRWHRGRADFVSKPTVTAPLAENARIILLGDWGSGIPRAARVAARVKEKLLDPAAAGVQKHVIHLGDVYYGGEEDEYLKNFLAPWPVEVGTRDVASYTLNGNHDMYVGGHHYYGTALTEPRFAAQGGSSMFVLANEHWQFVGLDTAYEDGGLHGNQAQWVRDLRREHPDRRTALLSHHQMFSAYEAGARTLRRKIEPVLKERPIDAWFWGHEHRCLAYRDLENVRFASCVGHGGIPEYLVDQSLKPPKGLVYEYRKQHGTGWQPWNTFGFAVLDIAGPAIHVRYVDEDGNEHWATDLP